jgi:hypothetical protein
MSRKRSNRKSDFLCDILKIKHLCATEGYNLLPACRSDIKQTRPLLWSALMQEETMQPEANAQSAAWLRPRVTVTGAVAPPSHATVAGVLHTYAEQRITSIIRG